MEVINHFLDWIWGIFHNIEFMFGTVNMEEKKTHKTWKGRVVIDPRGESTVFQNGYVVKLPSKYLCL